MNLVRLRARVRIECSRGIVTAGQVFAADPASALYWIKRRHATLVDPADSVLLFAELQRRNAARRHAA